MAATALQGVCTTVPVDVIQLDDGYQSAVGDCLEMNRKFPHGLAWLAEIRRAGFTPGRWVAPFIAQRRSGLFREHPDWFMRGAGGIPSAGWNPDWRWSERDSAISSWTFCMEPLWMWRRTLRPDQRCHVFDSWNDRYLGCHAGRVQVGDVPPHGISTPMAGAQFHLSPARVPEGARVLAAEAAEGGVVRIGFRV